MVTAPFFGMPRKLGPIIHTVLCLESKMSPPSILMYKPKVESPEEEQREYDNDVTNPFAFFYDLEMHTIVSFNSKGKKYFIPENKLMAGMPYLEMKVEVTFEDGWYPRGQGPTEKKELTVYFKADNSIFTKRWKKILECYEDDWIEITKNNTPVRYNKYEVKSLRIIVKE